MHGSWRSQSYHHRLAKTNSRGAASIAVINDNKTVHGFGGYAQGASLPLDIMAAKRGESAQVLSQAVVRQMLTPRARTEDVFNRQN